MTTALADQQRALLAALWSPKTDNAMALIAPHLVDAHHAGTARGLQAYRANGRALARRALEGAFPVTTACLGEDNFAPLVAHFWRAHPPQRGDIAQWGAQWPDALASVPGLMDDQPLLPDIARLEWALHLASTAADAEPALETLAVLGEHDPDEIHLHLAPGVAIVASSGPVVSAWAGGGNTLHTGAQTALVWRDGLAPQARVADTDECRFLRAVLAGATLAGALAAAPAFDAVAWLAPAAQQRLLLGAQRREQPEPRT